MISSDLSLMGGNTFWNKYKQVFQYFQLKKATYHRLILLQLLTKLVTIMINWAKMLVGAGKKLLSLIIGQNHKMTIVLKCTAIIKYNIIFKKLSNYDSH